MQTGRESNRLFKVHYPELDLVRAVAIILVMLRHFSSSYPLPQGLLLTRLLGWGWVGVDLFFVLSGFLIGGQIIEDTLAGRFSFKIFYLKRFLRIFPAYYFSLAVYGFVYTVVAHGSIHDIANDLIVHALYLQLFLKPSMYGGIYWTLAVEENFYLVIPFLLFWIIRYFKKHLLISLISMQVLIRIIGIATIYYPHELWMTPLRGFGDVVAGVIVAYLYIVYKERLLKTSGIWLALIPLVSALTLWWSFTYDGTRSSPAMELIIFGMISLGFSTLVFYMTLCSIGRYIVFKKTIGLVARLSYTMYLYHVLVAILLVRFAPSLLPQGNASILHFFKVFAVYFLVVVLMSAVMYSIIEIPCLKYRNRVLARRREKSPAG